MTLLEIKIPDDWLIIADDIAEQMGEEWTGPEVMQLAINRGLESLQIEAPEYAKGDSDE
jgi:hypothetical protein